jgi:hypothetical protein
MVHLLDKQASRPSVSRQSLAKTYITDYLERSA